MMYSFPNIRFGLMVGIAGGAPGKHDIRLGDIVIGCAGNGKGGVFGYDFGKATQGQGFQETGFLNQPPPLLRTTVSGLKTRYERKGHQLSKTVDMILEKNPRLRRKYKQPESGTDNLFKSEVTHDLNCGAICSDDTSNFVSRPERTEDEDNPAIHYGLVALADRLMKDALARDRLSEEKEVLCFEMEAAGLMNHFPCLVIRGICDYSDSHKNKEWQGYAAMLAAAYAKDLLCQIVPNRVEVKRKISDILSGCQEIAQEHRDVSKEHHLANERLSEEQQRCHQLFRLTIGSKDTTYEWYKDRVEERIEGTCMWLLKHDHFQTWLNQESGPLLISADPGCGKSVLAKYLIDHGLPRSTTICYFFFKDQDQNTIRQALCALLHQLFSLKPLLIEHAMPQFRKDGQCLINSTESLWKILRNAIRDSQSGPVIIVLDALDECGESEFADLMRNILSKFRILLDAFPSIHIPGEEELKTISQEVNHVITHRIKELARKKRFSTQIRSHLEKRLQETTHRTYLWVYLIFDYLENHGFKKTEKGVESAVATLPKGINEAYEQILNKANKDPMVRKVLSIILAASRPLTVSEMNVAVNIDDEFEFIDDLDLEDDEDFKTRLRSCVYFIHQTAREFLLADLVSPTPVSSELHWLHSITTRDAHAILAKLCVLYLNFFNSNVTLLTDIDGEASYDAGKFPLLDYSAETWGTHFREAGFMDDDSISYSVWFRIYWKTSGKMTTKCFTDLMIGSYYGHYVIVKLLLDKGAEVEAKDSKYGHTPLSLAAENGYEAVVKLLLDKGNARIEDSIGRTPLYFAAKNGHDTVAMALIRHYSINLDQEDDYGSTPLSVADRFGRTSWYWAKRCRNFEIQQLLLDYAEKRGIAVCENDGEVIEESFISNDGTSIFCDVCTLSIPEDVVFYHCEVCNGGDFDICPGCYQIGGRCLGDGHELAQKNNIKE
ncbi:hypothetical protein BKA59DRAFT_504533 [Fusarium tricinctum]|uniref:Ankyrin n=1 Tax=Fusarium tricinctum TaxID=61284 RepID=A0A8K0RJI1_9HYPO|nr:hypothetical protein BKA59DRAFT_504533 [Fusarium tricinctum]